MRTVVGLINIDVTYCKTHFGHQKEIRYLPIPTNVYETIAGIPIFIFEIYSY